MQPVTMVSAGCRAPRVLFDARRFDALAFSEGFSFSRKRVRSRALMYHISNVHRTHRCDACNSGRPVEASYVGRTYDHHGHEPLKPVSPVSILAACTNGRVGNMRRFERKSNPKKGQRTAWTHPGIYT